MYDLVACLLFRAWPPKICLAAAAEGCERAPLSPRCSREAASIDNSYVGDLRYIPIPYVYFCQIKVAKQLCWIQILVANSSIDTQCRWASCHYYLLRISCARVARQASGGGVGVSPPNIAMRRTLSANPLGGRPRGGGRRLLHAV